MKWFVVDYHWSALMIGSTYRCSRRRSDMRLCHLNLQGGENRLCGFPAFAHRQMLAQTKMTDCAI
jgi:hypothetical protein